MPPSSLRRSARATRATGSTAPGKPWAASRCASGKVLLLDKVLGVADALGYDVLFTDEKEAREFAEHLALALERPRITVDLPGLTVGY